VPASLYNLNSKLLNFLDINTQQPNNPCTLEQSLTKPKITLGVILDINTQTAK